MRRVTMHTLYAGPDRAVAAGDTAEFDDAQAEQLVAGGYGVYADAPRRPSAAAGPGRRRRRRDEDEAEAEEVGG